MTVEAKRPIRGYITDDPRDEPNLPFQSDPHEISPEPDEKQDGNYTAEIDLEPNSPDTFRIPLDAQDLGFNIGNPPSADESPRIHNYGASNSNSNTIITDDSASKWWVVERVALAERVALVERVAQRAGVEAPSWAMPRRL
jgi:hypothetical protein